MIGIEIRTYGCSMNKGASETIAGILKQKGFLLKKGADLLIINTCTVKTPTENKILKELKALQRERKKVIVAGCLPAARPNVVELFPEFSFLGTNIEDVANAVEETINGRRYVKIGRGTSTLGAEKVRESQVIGIVPISQGCLGACNYCLVKKARGDLVSFPRKDVVDEVKSALSSGAKEIWLTSQDCGAYGIDRGENLAQLISGVANIDGDFMIRVGMSNPNHVKNILPELIEAYKNEKVYKFLHIPVQSGDNKVLKDMNRFYTREEFIEVIKEFRKIIPDITISTDVIAGYPTENETAYKRTLSLLKEIKPDELNISRFWARPGTPAEKLKQLPGRVTNQRSREAAVLFKKISAEKNDNWVGWKGRALVSEIGKHKTYMARNYAYKAIVLHSRENILGEFVNVRVTASKGYYLEGEIV
jgi:threonylcarbamoyladenosine tRNA methylthiotransferase CDKAL1